MKLGDHYSNIICELCNNELRSIWNFRKELIFKQTNLYAHVDGDDSYEQIEASEDLVPSIKHEITDPVVVKSEHGSEPAEDFSMYSEFVYEHEESSHLFQAEEEEEEKAPTQILKKHYKRAPCGICGNSYYKDQLQRHIDVSLFVLKLMSDL